MISNGNFQKWQIIYVHSYIYKRYTWSAACVDFVSSYVKIGATTILRNVEMHDSPIL